MTMKLNGHKSTFSGPARHRSRGIALVSVLWVLVLLSSVAAATVMAARTNATVNRNLIDAADARNLAEGAIHLAVLNIYRNDTGGWDGNGSSHQLRIGDALVEVVALNETGKVDLNFASGELLRRVLVAAGSEVERAGRIAAAIQDWRDPDSLYRLNGAEARAYKSAGLDYGPANAQFASVNELQYVLGMDAELFASMQPAVTVYSRQKGINLAAAPPLVLWAAGNASQAEGAGALPANVEENFSRAALVRGVKREFVARTIGNVYSITAQANADNGAVARTSAVVRLDRSPNGVPFSVLAWDAPAAASSAEQTL
jgi:general secretion pathway protein K